MTTVEAVREAAVPVGAREPEAEQLAGVFRDHSVLRAGILERHEVPEESADPYLELVVDFGRPYDQMRHMDIEEDIEDSLGRIVKVLVPSDALGYDGRRRIWEEAELLYDRQTDLFSALERSCRSLMNLVSTASEESFLADQKMQWAASYLLTVIGRTALELPEKIFREMKELTQLACREMAALTQFDREPAAPSGLWKLAQDIVPDIMQFARTGLEASPGSGGVWFS